MAVGFVKGGRNLRASEGLSSGDGGKRPNVCVKRPSGGRHCSSQSKLGRTEISKKELGRVRPR